MHKNLLLGVEAIAQGALDGGISECMPIRVRQAPKSLNTFSSLLELVTAKFTAPGQLMKRPLWKLHWECRIRANAHWFV